MVAVEQLRTAGYVLAAPQFAGTVDVPANVHSQSLRTELGRRGFATDRFFLVGNVFNEARGNGTPLTTNATRLWRYLAGYDTRDAGAVTARVRLFGSDEGYRQSFSAIAANRDSESLTRLQRVHTQELGATADATYHRGHFALVTGADVRDIRATDNETPVSKGSATGLQGVSARQRYTGGFGEVLGERGGWSGAASVRVDAAQNLDTRQIVQTPTNSSVTEASNRTEYVASPRAGVVRQFGARMNVHASGFRAFRSPTMNELYRTGQVGQETTLANSSLQSERATGWEVGAQLLAGHATTVQATYFWTEINRPVSAVEIAQTATTITEMRENLGQIRSRGVELSADLCRGRAIWGSVGYQYADATVTRFSAQPSLVGKWIPEVPRQTATAQLHGRSVRLGEATLALRTSGQAFDDSANTFVLRRFFTLDLEAKRAITRRLDGFVVMQNLFNQRADVSRTPVLTLGSPFFAEAGLRLRLGSGAVSH
jgi:outer membrane receptor protein involved in Fe transport